jgi:hypothetical protein
MTREDGAEALLDPRLENPLRMSHANCSWFGQTMARGSVRYGSVRHDDENLARPAETDATDCHGREDQDTVCLPQVSGGEAAWALRRAGLSPRLNGPDHIAMFRGPVCVVHVPLRDRLHHGVLVAILKTVGVAPETFARYLDAEPPE